jgi:hypothetical protein
LEAESRLGAAWGYSTLEDGFPGDLIDAVVEIVRRIDDDRCPRCGSSIGGFPAGSRATRCRCIPVCSECGGQEALRPFLMELTAWVTRPSSPDGVFKMRVPHATGGWAEFGHDDPATDEEERRGHA